MADNVSWSTRKMDAGILRDLRLIAASRGERLHVTVNYILRLGIRFHNIKIEGRES